MSQTTLVVVFTPSGAIRATSLHKHDDGRVEKTEVTVGKKTGKNLLRTLRKRNKSIRRDHYVAAVFVPDTVAPGSEHEVINDDIRRVIEGSNETSPEEPKADCHILIVEQPSGLTRTIDEGGRV